MGSCWSRVLSLGNDWWSFYRNPILFLLFCDLAFIGALIFAILSKVTVAVVITGVVVCIQLTMGLLIVISELIAWIADKRRDQNASAFIEVQ